MPRMLRGFGRRWGWLGLALLLLTAAASTGSADESRDQQIDPLPEGARARLGSPRFRHDRPLGRVAISPDNKFVVSGDDLSTGMVWDLATGQVVARLAHFDGRDRLEFSPNSNFVGANGVFDARTGQSSKTLRYNFQVFVDDERMLVMEVLEKARTLLLTREGEQAVREFPGRFIGWDGAAQTVTTQVDSHKTVVWDLTTGEELFQAALRWLQCQFNGRLIVASDGAFVHDVIAGRKVPLAEGVRAHFDNTRSAFAPDGAVLAAADSEFLYLWDTRTGAVKHKLAFANSPLAEVRFSPDGKHLATASNDGPVRLWEVATGRLVHEAALGQALAFSADSAILVTTDQQSIRLWETATGVEIRPQPGTRSAIQQIAYSPDGRRLAVASLSGPILLWDVATAKVLRHFPVGSLSPYAVSSLAFSPDGKRLAHADGAALVVVSTETGAELHRFDSFQVPVQAVAFSPDGKAVAGAGSVARELPHFREHTTLPEVRVWNLTTGQELPSAQGKDPDDCIVGITFRSPEVVMALAADQNEIYDLRTKDNLVTLPRDHFLSKTAFSPDGTWLAYSGEPGKVNVIELASGKLVHQLPADISIGTIGFAPDGRQLAGVGSVEWNEPRFRAWDLTTGEQVPRFTNLAHAFSFAYAPDGRALATAGADTTVLLWPLAAAAK